LPGWAVALRMGRSAKERIADHFANGSSAG
jgi:hypothetical protein